MLSGALSASAVLAGAWPRDQGGVFASLAYELTTPEAAIQPEALALDPTPPLYSYTALYAEYGLRPWLTVGLDTGQQEGPDTWSGVVFVRVPIGSQDGRHRFAVQLGLGQRRYEQEGPYYGIETIETEWIARPTLAWGMGFDSPWGPAWAGAEASVEWRADTAGQPVKLDLTTGVTISPRTTVLLQLQTGDYPDNPPYAKLLPGLVVRLLPWLSLESSAILSLVGDDKLGARTALWLEF
ncbi:hypothetical protein BV911_06115 [Pseudoruegeria sp. SK021]|nr:hypothetical protein BV911_06115 [Pseudoruegeria sp. SK021]